jgi:hypothetical protein
LVFNHYKCNGICIKVGALPPIRARPNEVPGPTCGRTGCRSRHLPAGARVKGRLQQSGGS